MRVSEKKRTTSIVLLVITFVLFAVPLFAQEEDPTDRPPVERLILSDSDVSRVPTIELLMVGRDNQGNALDLRTETINISHNGAPVGPIQYVGEQQVGTLTLFLLDIPTGVSAQLPDIQNAIKQYASPEFMTEQVDSIAVYQVGGDTAVQLLAPTGFYNSIQNLFATPLLPETEATALFDSTVDLLNQVEGLKPDARMVASIVLMTDGTDAISVENTHVDVVDRAAQLGIPVQTILLNNSDLTGTPGASFLTDLAANSGGISAQLAEETTLPPIWRRIGSFRDQARISYLATGLTGGEATVTVSLASNPDVVAETAVQIPANIPSVIINLPPDSRTLTLPNVDDPTKLRFSITVSWLDGVERELSAAQLIINNDDSTPYEIPLNSLDDFVVEATNLTYGNNPVEAIILDEQGMRATSASILLTVNEGPVDIPDALDGGGNVLGAIGRFFFFLLIVVLIGGGLFFLWRKGLFANLRMPKKGGGNGRRQRTPSTQIHDTIQTPAANVPQKTIAYLELLDATSQVSSPIPLSGTVIRIGRNPSMCEIAFAEDVTVSRYHANLMREGNGYRIFDERSTSGTWVNERQVPEYGTQLLDGDEIHLGAVHLRYRRA